MEISQERYDYIKGLKPEEADYVLSQLESSNPGTTEAYHGMTKKIKIDTALDAFGDTTGKKMGPLLSELGSTGLKYTKLEVEAATKDAQITEEALTDLGNRKIKASEGFWDNPFNNKELTFKELNNQIEVNTGLNIEDYKSEKEYKQAVNKTLDQMKSNLPPSVYNERKGTILNALRSIRIRTPEHTGQGKHEEGKAIGGYSPSQITDPYGTPFDLFNPRRFKGSVSALTEYFELKKDDNTADSILEGMFNDPEIYQLWLKESK